ncbi:MAG: flavin reductase family protein [Flavobacteriales bacterium]|nr:flavin reductase family protein [Flavobacteriales bacterium]
MKTLIPSELPIPKLHHYLLGAVVPRPIAFASTISKEGVNNLSPFSFFNVFSANPPILIFSPSRSGRTGETKNTHDYILEVPEVVINVVNYEMVHQMSLASSPFPKGVDEFVKSGFTPIDSHLVRPKRVKESPVQLECEVLEVKELGQGGGAGNLVICLVKCIHIKEEFLNDEGMIDQTRIDLVARMGGNWYCRANGEALFEVQKPLTTIGIGIDALPDHIKNSENLTGNQLGKLGSLEHFPSDEEKIAIKNAYANESDHDTLASDLIDQGEVFTALCLLL